ncbi:MAG: hypothetical protein KatS3mg110_1339 [Pirellulaceae bacterium]|nr:MAG: hypothetical protein KatS3mg110_1339 [Pirellulaceae bacterium]
MSGSARHGGVVHVYQKYNPLEFPPPTQPPPDVLEPVFRHWLRFGRRRRLTAEELANAVHLDPSQIAGLGPTLDALIDMLRERKRKILATYETQTVRELARRRYQEFAARLEPPASLRNRYQRSVQEEQIYELERLWLSLRDERSPFARSLVQLIARLGDQYQIEELAAKYAFTGREPLSIEKALQIKEELEAIDKLLAELEKARRTARIGVIDLDELSRFVETADVERLRELQRAVTEYLRQLAELQGLEPDREGFRLTPKAMRLFQGRLLEQIFSQLQPSRTGRHTHAAEGEGAVELPQTRPYQFGDSITQMDIPQSLINALVRNGPGLPIALRSEDIVIHRSRCSPKCATAVILDMSGSMRYDGQYVNVKRMALAFEGLIRREFPGDFVQFIEMYSVARLRAPGEILDLMPKPVTIFDPFVALRVDMSRPEVTEYDVPPHFTNIQHALRLARQALAGRDTPNRQILLITDGLPTAHFQDQWLYLLFPPHASTEQATLQEALACARDGIVINIFLLSTWAQSELDIRFAYKVAEAARGRVFFTAGEDLDRFVVWDYIQRRRQIIG